MQEACNRLSDLYELPLRESEILLLLIKGRSTKFIPDALVISEYTAKTHVYNIYKKMDVHLRNELLDLHEKTPRSDCR